MFLPFRWVAGNERGEKSYVAAILCCAARANLEGVASCSTTLSSSTSGQDPPSPGPLPLSVPPPDSTPRHLVVSSCCPPSPPPSRRPRSCSPLSDSRTHRLSILYYMSGPKLLDARTTPPPPYPPSSILFLYSPVTYSAVGVFFNNERNVSSTSDSFTTKNDFPRSDTRIDAGENNSRRYQQKSNLDAITFYRCCLIIILLLFLSYLS